MYKNTPANTYSGSVIVITLNDKLPTPTKNALRVVSEFVPALNRLAQGDWGDVKSLVAKGNSAAIRNRVSRGQKIIGVYGVIVIIGITRWSQQPETRTHILNPKIMLLDEALRMREYREMLSDSR